MNTPLAKLEDSALIERALAGQAECFAALVDRHAAAVRMRIRSMARNPMETDDVLQEVLLKVWRSLSTFRREASFRTWMTRVAVNEVLQSYRQAQRHPTCQPLGNLNGFVSPDESPDRSVARVEEKQALRTALVKLPAKYRRVLILRDLEERSARETARSLRSSVPAVKTRLFRARLMLLKTLQRSMVKKPTTGAKRAA
jgi:RNA polymerase sigma-70 factor (ECF subfamily)